MNKPLKIAIGADHGGFELKENLSTHLKSQGHVVIDCGTHSKDAVDYPVIAKAVAQQVSAGLCPFGIMIDGAGIGSTMAANRVHGVRAAACYNEALARNSREHNDANLLVLGAGQINIEQAKAIVGIFLSTDCTEERHRRRVRLIMEIERERARGGLRSDKESNLDISPEDVERIAKRVKEMIGQGGTVAKPTGAPRPTPEQLAKMIDHTLLKPEASTSDIEKLCAEALKCNFYSVCVNPANVRQAAGLLRNSTVKVCCVVGFPLGAQSPEIKALEARRSIREGAKEIDMVINIGALRSKEDALVLRDIRGVVETCKESRVLCKVILETSLLNNEEKVRACELSMKANADFVKTSTGFSTGGATAEDIALMARTVASRKLGVKASGGVRTYGDALKMIEAGATRIGASSSVKIIEEARSGVVATSSTAAGAKAY